MNFIHYIDKAKLNSVLKNGIKVNDCYHGKGILIYPNKEIPFETDSLDVDLVEDEKLSNSLSIHEKWEKIGALGLRQNGKTVCAVNIDLPSSCWPLKVFIDINHQIAKELGKLLDAPDLSNIKLISEDTLTEIVTSIESPRYILKGSFIINSEINLIKLMETFQKAGGGIWGAHSFDCMTESDIPFKSLTK